MQEHIPLLLNRDPSKIIGHATLYESEFLELLRNAIANDTPDFTLCWGVKTDHTLKTKSMSYLGFNQIPACSTLELTGPRWNLISEVGLPGPEYDWVLVKTDLFDDESVPHVAELRMGVWWARDIDLGPMEEVLGNKVIAWFDMQSIL